MTAGAGRPGAFLAPIAGLLALACLATPVRSQVAAPPRAAAEPASGRPAGALCDHYSEMMSAAEIAEFEERLILLAPVRFAEAAHAVRIVNTDNDNELAPHFIPAQGGAPPTIGVPRGFRRLQCRLVQTGFYILLQPQMRTARMQLAMDACVADEGDAAACIETVVTTITRMVEGEDAGAAFSDEVRQHLWGVTDTAFLSLLLHEFAHLALGHSGGPGEESAADTYALLRTVISGEFALGSFWTFAIMSLADPHLVDRGGGHGRFACRASISNDVLSSIFNLSADVSSWIAEPRDRYVERRRTSAGTRPSRLYIVGDAAGCPSGATEAVGAVERDLEALVSLLDRLAQRPAAGSGVPAMEEILALPMVTEEARILRMSVVGLRLRQAARATMDPVAEAPLLALVRRILDQDVAYMTSEDYGRLYGSAAILAYDQGPPGSEIRVMNAALRAQLLRTEYYNPRFHVLNLHLGVVEYEAGRCAEGRRRLLRLIEFSDDPAGQRSYLAPLLVEMNAEACAATAEAIRADARARRGWR